MTEQALEAGGGHTPFFSPSQSGPVAELLFVSVVLMIIYQKILEQIDLNNMQMT